MLGETNEHNCNGFFMSMWTVVVVTRNRCLEAGSEIPDRHTYSLLTYEPAADPFTAKYWTDPGKSYLLSVT